MPTLQLTGGTAHFLANAKRNLQQSDIGGIAHLWWHCHDMPTNYLLHRLMLSLQQLIKTLCAATSTMNALLRHWLMASLHWLIVF